MKKSIKLLLVITAVVLTLMGLTGCGGNSNGETQSTVIQETSSETTASESVSKEETKEETSSVAESLQTESDAKKPVILVVSFGTSYNDSRDITIGAIEQAIADAYPEYEVRRAFTSQTIIDILKERDQLEIDNVEEAFHRLVADGVKEVVVQPTHVMSGYEYDDLFNEVSEYVSQFETISMGSPLLSSEEDFEQVVQVLKEETAEYDSENTAIVFMGHGTEHKANNTYQLLQDKFVADGFSNYIIGTVEATPSLEDVIAALKEGGFTKVVLEPLMVVAGDHANNDMAGEEADSWKNVMTAEGFEVECLIRGLGESSGIQKLYVEHVQEAIHSPSLAERKEGESDAAQKENTEQIQLVDGTYPISVSSSSSMFKIIDAQLTVEKGTMSAVLTLSGTGYEKLYMGTKEAALEATEEEYCYFSENEEGKYTYEIPVEALDKEIDCAAWSIKKSEWYDRTLVFESTSLPEEALKN